MNFHQAAPAYVDEINRTKAIRIVPRKTTIPEQLAINYLNLYDRFYLCCFDQHCWNPSVSGVNTLGVYQLCDEYSYLEAKLSFLRLTAE
ncbi:MAG: hypothetical protein MH252_15525 [Thermosynechococcaceae cyanobacterium MS004]|nr:hypothetical protein [Thermosynechococcaceae cyanobacterium MS004]